MTLGTRHEQYEGVADEAYPGLSFWRVLTPVVTRFWRILVVAILAAAVVGVATFMSPRRFDARLAFSTIGSTRLGGLAASLPAALLAATSTNGLQATPALLQRLVRSQVVDVQVARTRVPGRGDSTVADLLLKRDARAIQDPVAAEALRKVVSADVERETGLVIVSTIHRDSALARFITQRVVDEVTTAFQRSVQSQVTETKSSLTQRHDAALARLRIAEEASRSFAFRNRVVTPFSAAAVERDRLSRDLTLAQTLYNQVVAEREGAKDRELEEVPAVVVVDPLPRQLVPSPRGTVSKAALTFAAAWVFLNFLVVLVDLLRTPLMSPALEQRRFREHAGRVPLLRWFVGPDARPR
jgi:hypothetical protein